MELGKLGTALGAGVVALSLSQAVLAAEVCPYTDNIRDQTVVDLQDMATTLRCVADAGYYNDTPIWKYRKDGDGCIVHLKVSKLLDEPRLFEEGSKPPQNKNNTAAGAANDLQNGKTLDAYNKLGEFINTILYNAVLNPKNPTAQASRDALVVEAGKYQACALLLL